ncbi:putative inactive lipase [Microbacterium lemovicicum]|uniref:Putative inactive lipase n=1 Tax=Microbacterium lemovicicum TaxID=1072463 RepID=A0A3S9W8J0_9MICO|nr:lipase family protein [Microbacterium lemovicicum]AZS36386.1 putative inactive lipase [Microbacterium lemovicicum]
MADHPRQGVWRVRFSALPTLLARTPPGVRTIAGLGVAVLGVMIVFRPLTSLLLLSVYVGCSAIISGLFTLIVHRSSPEWWTRVFAVLWLLGGTAVLIWLGRSFEVLPVVLAILIILGGLAALGDAVLGGSVSERVLAAAWGGAQLAFGILSLTWPDVTLLVVAVVFGARTIVFGAASVIGGIRELARRAQPPESAGTVERARARRGRAWAAGGRYALALMLITASAAGWGLNDWLADGAPVLDGFYDPPDDVPSEHGRLIRADDYVGWPPAGGEVQRILYTTQDSAGRAAVASALVITPVDPPPGPRPVVSWNHGTTGVARSCAPSLREDSAIDWAIPAVDEVMARGWVVVASDYSGQGAPGVFPYLIGAGEARSSLDAVLAAREAQARSTTGFVELGSEVAVWGHSQGGHAALWTAQLARDYTPQLTIVGTAVAAPVADPKALAGELIRGGAGAELSVLTAWVLAPYSQTYPDVSLNTYVTPAARAIVREMTQRCLLEPGVVVSLVSALGVSEDRPIYSAGLIGGALGDRLAQNAATGPFPSPVLAVWGSADEVVPPRLQEEWVRSQCDAGTAIDSAVLAGYSHVQPITPGSRFLPTLMRWTAERFDGRSAPAAECAG